MMTALAQVQTRHLIFAAIITSVLAGVCDFLDKLSWQYARSVSHAFDITAMILFWASYILLWALLILGPFRPQAEFSIQGECGKRATNFFIALGGLLAIHVWVVLEAVIAFS
jgi:hypothetical protein